MLNALDESYFSPPLRSKTVPHFIYFIVCYCIIYIPIIVLYLAVRIQ